MNAAVLALSLAAAAAELAGDPCAPVAPLAADPAAAEVYRRVAANELAAGARATAVVALRAAAARDPGDAASRATLERLCAEQGADPFARGVALLEAGDARGALHAFRAARDASGPSPSLALLEGITRIELGDDAGAEPLLREAERSPEHRDAARLHLGILRLRAGDAVGAAALFDAAGRAPGLSSLAADLGRLARRDGRLVVSLLAETSWDSNVTLAPRDAEPGPEDDGGAGLTAAALWRPRGPNGPYLRAEGGFTRMRSLGAYDFAAAGAAAGWQLRHESFSLAAEYDFGRRTLGGEDYLTAHRILAAAAWGRRVVLSATYSARLEDYAGDYEPYSGPVHRARVRLAVPLGGRAWLGLAYGAARDLAEADDLASVEHGPRADLWVAVGRRVRLGLEAGASFATYDEADVAAGVVREDVVLAATGLLEVDLGARLTARLALHGRRGTSTIDALSYEKVVPTLGLAWVHGIR